MSDPKSDQPLTTQELVRLSAVDPVFFMRTFFPKTFRQNTPEFHRTILRQLENPDSRHVAIEVFRGGAKTTLLRAFAARRIAFGLSRTILFISRAQEYALESVVWLQKQVLHNQTYAQTFGLRQGVKWSADNSEIVHGVMGHSVRILARGITGQNRGVNIEDYRPDLIVVDDADDEETTNTDESRRKTQQLFFGAIEKSLARPADAPHAKIVLLQTPLHRDDLVETCLRDPQWNGLRFGCFDSNGESIWPDQFTTADLQAEKLAASRRNQMSIWMREMECRVISSETATFRPEWLDDKYDLEPERMAVYMAIDPAPPQSEKALKTGADTDYQAIAVVGFHRGTCYLLDYSLMRNAEFEETAAEFFRLAGKWRPRVIGVESVAYQRTLAHYLKQKMRSTGRHYVVQEVNDRRKKADRIRQALAGLASNGQLRVRAEHVEFISQFTDYPGGKHDDLLDAVSMAVQLGRYGAIDAEYEVVEDESEIPALDGPRFAV